MSITSFFIPLSYILLQTFYSQNARETVFKIYNTQLPELNRISQTDKARKKPATPKDSYGWV